MSSREEAMSRVHTWTEASVLEAEKPEAEAAFNDLPAHLREHDVEDMGWHNALYQGFMEGRASLRERVEKAETLIAEMTPKYATYDALLQVSNAHRERGTHTLDYLHKRNDRTHDCDVIGCVEGLETGSGG